jgi:hypothetical protein
MDNMIDVSVLKKEMSFEDAKIALKKIWRELRIPTNEQAAFQKKHFFASYTRQDEVAILSTINELILCREKLIEIFAAVKARELLISEIEKVGVEVVIEMQEDTNQRPVTPAKKRSVELDQQLVKSNQKVLKMLNELQEEYGRYYGSELDKKFIYKGQDLLQELVEQETSAL